MRFGSLFSGIGGFDLGFERAGMQPAWQVEIADHPTRILEKHWPDVERYRDVKEVGKHNLESVELICGGFPCQPVSVAGKRQASADERDMWPEFARIIDELRPRWVVAENVRGILSAENGRYFGGILRDLAGFGYDAEWQVLSAREFGAPHQRDRVYFVAYPHKVDGKAGLGNKQNGTSKIFTGGPAVRNGFWLQAPNTTRGVDDGLPAWFYQVSVESYANAVVPQIAEWIGKRIMETTSE